MVAGRADHHHIVVEHYERASGDNLPAGGNRWRHTAATHASAAL
jgi:hypothetical protein